MDNDFKMLKEYAEKRLADIMNKLDELDLEGNIPFGAATEERHSLLDRARAYNDIIGMANRISGE